MIFRFQVVLSGSMVVLIISVVGLGGLSYSKLFCVVSMVVPSSSIGSLVSSLVVLTASVVVLIVSMLILGVLVSLGGSSWFSGGLMWATSCSTTSVWS